VDLPVATPHDDLFHSSFQHVRHAGSWLADVLPKALVRAVDWRSLRPAPEKLRDRQLRLSVPDLVFLVEDSRTRTPLWLVVEHKATRDPDVERQMLRYSVHLGDRAPEPGIATPVPVVAVLLHHGEAPFATAVAPPGDAFAAWQPRQPLLVDDLRRQDEDHLRGRGLTPLATLTLLCLRALRGMSSDEALAAFDRWGDLLRAADRDDGPPAGPAAVAAIGRYALFVVEVSPRELHDTFERLLQRPEETIMSTAERLRREGKAEGKAEGIAEGRAETILRMVTKRFGAVPEHLVARVRNGSPADLDRWTDRILDARSLAEVFAE